MPRRLFGINGSGSLKAYEFLRHRILMLDGGNRLTDYGNITVDYIYRKRNKLEGLLFRLGEHVPFDEASRWYGDWQKHVGEFDTVIIFDGLRSPALIKFIKRRNPLARIIIYYVNVFGDRDRNAPWRYRDMGVEFYSFDRVASQKFGLNFKPFFYEYEHIAQKILAQNLPVEYDAIFFGADKGRLADILDADILLKNVGLTTKIAVYADKKRSYRDEEKKYLFKGWSDYITIAAATAKARAIIDITTKGQSGLTLRPMEAVFMGKKLITDNDDIVNYDIYSPQNVFLLGKDDPSHLVDFVRSKASVVADKILDNYRKEAWIEGFFA